MQADINATLNIPEWVPYVLTETTESNGNVADLIDAISTLYQTLDGIVNSATDREDDTNVLNIDQDEEMEFIFERLPAYFEGNKVNVACGVVNSSETHVTEFAATLSVCMRDMVEAAVPNIEELRARVEVVNADKTKVDIAKLISDIDQASQAAADSTNQEPIVSALDSCIVESISYLKQGLDSELQKLNAVIPEDVLTAEKEAWSQYEVEMESNTIYLNVSDDAGDDADDDDDDTADDEASYYANQF